MAMQIASLATDAVMSVEAFVDAALSRRLAQHGEIALYAPSLAWLACRCRREAVTARRHRARLSRFIAHLAI